MIFYFSATGNSRFVAQTAASLLGEKRLVDLRIFYQSQAERTSFPLAKGERIGFIFPTHAWGLPKGLDRILSSLQFSGYDDNNYCYMICTCGDDVGETARLWRRAVKGAGLHGDAAFSVAMPNTYVCLPGFDVDDTQTATRKLENAPTAIQGIIDKICAKSVGDFSFHGKFAFLKTRIIRPFFLRFLAREKILSFHQEMCVACKICAGTCPTGNISTTDGRPQWHARCIGCLACYHHCPSHAISCGRYAPFEKGQYLHPSLKRQ